MHKWWNVTRGGSRPQVSTPSSSSLWNTASFSTTRTRLAVVTRSYDN